MRLKSIFLIVVLTLFYSSAVRAFDPFASLILEEDFIAPSIQTNLARFRQALTAAAAPDDSYPLFLTALSYIHQYYLRPLDLSEIIHTATQTLRNHSVAPASQIQGRILSSVMSSLDRYSLYYNQEHFNRLLKATSGSFSGIGVTIAYDPLKQTLRIVDVLPDTPAHRARLLPQDIIHRIDAVPVFTFEEALDRLTGPVNSRVDLTIQRRESSLFQVTLYRQTIQIPSHTVNVIALTPSLSQIAHIRLPYFSERLVLELKETLSSLPNIDGLVLDLRDNPGGLLDQAIKMVDLFLPPGKLFLSLYTKEEKMSLRTQGTDTVPTLPIAVLINDRTASAAEIVAASLQDHNRALLFGTRTFGKGSIQNSIELTPEHFIHLTTGLYSRASGDLVECFGINPNVAFTFDRDLGFNCEHAVDSQGAASVKAAGVCPAAYLEEDPILSCALMTLNHRVDLFPSP